MRKIVYCSLTVLIALTAKLANAQDYKTALGVKFGGYENGFSVKYFPQNNVALEGVLGFRDGGVVVTGLYEIHQEAFGVPELKFYFGAGAHIGAIGSGVYHTFDGSNQTYNESHVLFGIDGVLGLEYIIPKSPIAISLDLNPRAELATGPFFDLAPGLGLKYTF
jgi:hypothetical protein